MDFYKHIDHEFPASPEVSGSQKVSNWDGKSYEEKVVK